VGNKHPKEILFLDGLRGLAALYVLIHHARWLLWEGYEEGFLIYKETYTFFEKMNVYLFSAFKFGHEAVLIFFVLSGFVIHLRYSKLIVEKGSLAAFDYFPYLKRRAVRILPPFLLALILTYLLDTTGAYFHLPIYFQQTSSATINENVLCDHSFLTLLGNLIFTMKIYVPVWGTDGPLWSLAYEWWFYMIYPLFFLLHKKNWLLSSAFILILFLGSVYIAEWPSLLLKKIFFYMIVWWLGVLLADIYSGKIQFDFKWISPLALLLIPLPLSIIPLSFSSYVPLLWGLGFCGLFSILFKLKETNFMIRTLNKLKPLGDISYSLYVVHFPLLVLLSGFIMKREGNLPPHFWYVYIGIVLGVGMGYLSYLTVEKRFLKPRLSLSSSASNPKTI
jgi:peptidoglycan/LPS O-acetylase OafA/YrhL